MLIWLADELAAAGLTVIETTGWKTRGTRNTDGSLKAIDPQGVVLHDTVTPPGLSRLAEQGILINGRIDLAGPLSQGGLHRDGVVSVIAAGRCSHNGYGTWGNDSIGLEVFCYGAQTGHEEPYNAIQREVAAVWSAVICRHMGWSAAQVKGHKETDPTRKRDPFGVDMVAMRGTVGALLNPPPEEDDMTDAQAQALANCEAAIYTVHGDLATVRSEMNGLGGYVQAMEARLTAKLDALAPPDPVP